LAVRPYTCLFPYPTLFRCRLAALVSARLVGLANEETCSSGKIPSGRISPLVGITMVMPANAPTKPKRETAVTGERRFLRWDEVGRERRERVDARSLSRSARRLIEVDARWAETREFFS